MRESIVNAIVCLSASGCGAREISFRLKVHCRSVHVVQSRHKRRIEKWRAAIQKRANEVARRLAR